MRTTSASSLSDQVGNPNARRFPFRFGIWTRLTGRHRHRSARTAAMMRPILASGRPRLPRSRKTPSTVSALCNFAYLPGLGSLNHLSHFALHPAFPDSLVGRHSHGYYWLSVTIGLAPRRRSRIRLCHTSERDVGSPLISLNALTGHRPHHGGCIDLHSMPTHGAAPVPGIFPAGARFHRAEIGLQAIQPLPYHAGPVTHPFDAFPRPRLSWHAAVPSTFRFRVSHQTQERSSKFLPTALGIRQSASTAHDIHPFDRDGPPRAAGGVHLHRHLGPGPGGQRDPPIDPRG